MGNYKYGCGDIYRRLHGLISPDGRVISCPTPESLSAHGRFNPIYRVMCEMGIWEGRLVRPKSDSRYGEMWYAYFQSKDVLHYYIQKFRPIHEAGIIPVYDYVPFQILALTSTTIHYSGSPLFYSYDNKHWQPLPEYLDLRTGDNIYVKGDVSYPSHFDLDGCEVYGDLSCLGPMQPYKFREFFANCNIDAADLVLPYDPLEPHCYERMFYESLIDVAPELPALTLAPYCYYEMFDKCTYLRVPPDLPSLHMEEHCYEQMFAGCSALEYAPDLPAMDLAPYCYTQMFMDCTSLTKAPDLPADTLEPHCYEGMFKGCTNIESVEIHADLEYVDKEYMDKMLEDCPADLVVIAEEGSKEQWIDATGAPDTIEVIPIGIKINLIGDHCSFKINDSLVVGDHTYVDAMDMYKLEVIPDDGYDFIRWTDSSDPSIRYITVEDEELTFECVILKWITITIGGNTDFRLDGAPYTSPVTVHEGTHRFQAVVPLGTRFVEWSTGSTVNPLDLELHNDFSIEGTICNIYVLQLDGNAIATVDGVIYVEPIFVDEGEHTITIIHSGQAVYWFDIDKIDSETRVFDVHENKYISYEVLDYIHITLTPQIHCTYTIDGEPYVPSKGYLPGEHTIVAIPSEGYQFIEWDDSKSIDASRLERILHDTTFKCIIDDLYYITILPNEHATFKVDGTVYTDPIPVYIRTSHNIEVIPEQYYELESWNTGYTDKSFNTTISSSVTYSVTTRRKRVTITISDATDLKFTVDGSNYTTPVEVLAGSDHTLTVTETGYSRFRYWDGKSSQSSKTLSIFVGDTNVTHYATYYSPVYVKYDDTPHSNQYLIRYGSTTKLTGTVAVKPDANGKGWVYVNNSTMGTDADVSIMFSPDTNYTFDYWQLNGTTHPTSGCYSFSNTDKNNPAIIKVYLHDPCTLTLPTISGLKFKVNDADYTGPITGVYNTTYTLSVEETGFTTFRYWNNDESATGFTYSITITSNYTVPVAKYNPNIMKVAQVDGCTAYVWQYGASDATTGQASAKPRSNQWSTIRLSSAAPTSTNEVSLKVVCKTGYKCTGFTIGSSTYKSSALWIGTYTATPVLVETRTVTLNIPEGCMMYVGDTPYTSTTTLTFDKGTSIAIGAFTTDATKYKFLSWTDGVTDATRVVTVDKNLTFSANMQKAFGVWLYADEFDMTYRSHNVTVTVNGTSTSMTIWNVSTVDPTFRVFPGDVCSITTERELFKAVYIKYRDADGIAAFPDNLGVCTWNMPASTVSDTWLDIIGVSEPDCRTVEFELKNCNGYLADSYYTIGTHKLQIPKEYISSDGTLSTYGYMIPNSGFYAYERRFYHTSDHTDGFSYQLNTGTNLTTQRNFTCVLSTKTSDIPMLLYYCVVPQCHVYYTRGDFSWNMGFDNTRYEGGNAPAAITPFETLAKGSGKELTVDFTTLGHRTNLVFTFGSRWSLGAWETETIHWAVYNQFPKGVISGVDTYPDGSFLEEHHKQRTNSDLNTKHYNDDFSFEMGNYPIIIIHAYDNNDAPSPR